MNLSLENYDAFQGHGTISKPFRFCTGMLKSLNKSKATTITKINKYMKIQCPIVNVFENILT